MRQLICEGLPLPPPHETDIPRVAFIDLDARHCRFVAMAEAVGPYVPQFCGLDVIPGLSWCRAHAARCLNLSDPRRPAPAAKPEPETQDHLIAA